MTIWFLKNIYRNYTPEEVLRIFREEHRLRSFLEAEVYGELELEITGEMTIKKWRYYSDLLSWPDLYEANNKIFKIDLPYEAWIAAVIPESRKLWDLCDFISQHAKKEIIKPVRIFGRDCLNAAVFLTLIKNLANRGIDMANVKPTTALRDFVNTKNYPYLMAEIVITGTRTFEFLKIRVRRDISFWRKINIFDTSARRIYLDTGNIETFGDLARKIAEEMTRG
ncbi:MAG: hypothetical protein A2Z25_14390 [Planctomycetes bacterium RBG_16_55_9]|nr:MAG: hypothetical protein A2Z25_14390 [Planctomycetes bacterium RBG_16_55_9]